MTVQAATADPDEVDAALTEVPGIGPWTAHGFLIFALDRPDVLLSGDLALRRAVEHACGLDHLRYCDSSGTCIDWPHPRSTKPKP